MSARRPRRARAIPPSAKVPPPPAVVRSRGWIGPALLVAVLAIGAALRIWLSLNDDGIFWPDEIYQSLEQAHRLVFGQGIVPWEFIEGARSWAFPATIAALLKLLSVLGLDDPRAYLDATRLVLSAVSVATAFGSYRLARAYGASAISAAAGASLYALAAPVIYLAPRALSETVSALPVVFGLALALPPRRSRRDRIIGAALIGLAVVFRLQNAIFAVGLLAILQLRRDGWSTRATTLVFAGWAAAYGILDQLTWGHPFQSAQLYIAANLATPDLTNTFGDVSVTTRNDLYFPPADYYVRFLLTSMWAPLIVAVLLGLFAYRRAAGLGLLGIAFIAVHSLIPHKELRYIVPVLPLLGALAGIGIDEAARLLGRQQARALLSGALVVAAAFSGATFHDLTYGQLGVQGNHLVSDAQGALQISRTPAGSAYDDPGPVDRLLLLAHSMPDLCGIKVEATLPEFQGGYTYLHRAVPLYRIGGPPRASGFFNYAIAMRGPGSPGDVRAAEGDVVLVRLGGTCTPDPAFDSRL